MAWHQTSSFNDFVENGIKTLDDVIIDPVVLSVSGNGKVLHFRFGQVRFQRPLLAEDDNRTTILYPHVAKMRGETYGSAVHVDVHVFTADSEATQLTPELVRAGFLRRHERPMIIEDGSDDADDGIENVEIGPGVYHRVEPLVYLTVLPIMLGSRLCRLHGLPNERLVQLGEPIYEPGGYFILRGKERVIIPQKNLGKNTLFITKEAGEITGTLHACMEAVDAPRVVNKFTIGYDKDIHDVIARMQVNQIYAPKGAPLGIMLFLLGMNDWNTVVTTIAAFACLGNNVTLQSGVGLTLSLTFVSFRAQIPLSSESCSRPAKLKRPRRLRRP